MRDPVLRQIVSVGDELGRRLAAVVASPPGAEPERSGRWEQELVLSAALSMARGLALERRAELAAGAGGGAGGTGRDEFGADWLVERARREVDDRRRAMARRAGEEEVKRQKHEATRAQAEIEGLRAALSSAADERERRSLLEALRAERGEEDGKRTGAPCACQPADPLCDCVPAGGPSSTLPCLPGDPSCEADGRASVAGAAVVPVATPSGLSTAVEQRTAALSRCFAGDRSPSDGAAVEVRARLDVTGALRDARVWSLDGLSPRIESCLLAELALVNAGPQAAPTVVSFPLIVR